MLNVWWQQFFEDNLKMSDPLPADNKATADPAVAELTANIHAMDCYQAHAFVLKKNAYFSYQRRFQVLTTYWLHNVEADFDKKTKTVVFKKAKWKLPIDSIETIELSVADNNVVLNMLVNKKKMNDTLNKEKRKLMFKDVDSARSFLYHTQRLSYAWNGNKRLNIVDKT